MLAVIPQPRFFRQPNKGGGEELEEEWKEDKEKREKTVRESAHARLLQLRQKEDNSL